MRLDFGNLTLDFAWEFVFGIRRIPFREYSHFGSSPFSSCSGPNTGLHETTDKKTVKEQLLELRNYRSRKCPGFRFRAAAHTCAAQSLHMTLTEQQARLARPTQGVWKGHTGAPLAYVEPIWWTEGVRVSLPLQVLLTANGLPDTLG